MGRAVPHGEPGQQAVGCGLMDAVGRCFVKLCQAVSCCAMLSWQHAMHSAVPHSSPRLSALHHTGAPLPSLMTDHGPNPHPPTHPSTPQVYAFSSENWGRPAAEVAFLLGLMERVLAAEVAQLAAAGVRLRFIGEEARLPPSLRRQIRRCLPVVSAAAACACPANTGLAVAAVNCHAWEAEAWLAGARAGQLVLSTRQAPAGGSVVVVPFLLPTAHVCPPSLQR